jgi:hypothetical protein
MHNAVSAQHAYDMNALHVIAFVLTVPAALVFFIGGTWLAFHGE